MKISKGFEIIAENLWDGVKTKNDGAHSNVFCCLTAEKYLSENTALKCFVVIMSLLDGEEFFEYWIIKNTKINPLEIIFNTKKMQHTRKMWMLHLADHYRKLGD